MDCASSKRVDLSIASKSPLFNFRLSTSDAGEKPEKLKCPGSCESPEIAHVSIYFGNFKLLRSRIHATVKFSPGTMEQNHVLHLILTG